MLELINTLAWVGANLLIAYTAIILVVFVITYYVVFDPKATTAGKMIFRFMLSLVGIIGLIVLSIYIDPSHSRVWFDYPDDVSSWRPLVRFVVYLHVAYTITSLSIVLFIRRWKPKLIKKASDMDLVQLRHTNEIQIIKLKNNDS